MDGPAGINFRLGLGYWDFTVYVFNLTPSVSVLVPCVHLGVCLGRFTEMSKTTAHSIKS